jgi:group I intron endonuclease
MLYYTMKNDELPVNLFCGIYGLRCKTTGKWYIGQSIEIMDRWQKAYECLTCKGQTKIYRAIKKYGYADFEKVILESCEPDCITLTEREDFWMDHFDSIENGYNIRQAGPRGKFSEETKQKMSDSAKNRNPISDETREKLSDAGRRRVWSNETCQKISQSKKGMLTGPMADDRRIKIQASLNSRTDTEVLEWKNNISRSLTGKKRKPFSEEHRRKISIANKKSRNSLITN